MTYLDGLLPAFADGATPHPLPPGRARWRLTLHERDFTGRADPNATLVTELVGARSRRVEKALSKAAECSFALDATLPAAAEILELQSEIRAWRYDEYSGADVCVFRGVVTNSQDTVSEQTATVHFTATDMFGLLDRRIVTSRRRFDKVDQDDIVNSLVAYSRAATGTGGTPSFTPGSYLPLQVVFVGPDGTPRGRSGRIRDRTYNPNQVVSEAISNLSEVIDGFDFQVEPGPHTDRLLIFYPREGIVNGHCPMVYGVTVAAFTRTINSANYANYVRVVGSAGSEEEDAPYGEAWAPEANQTGQYPVGLWMRADSASDVARLETLAEKAAGLLQDLSAASPATSGRHIAGLQILPSYSLQLRPGVYRWGYPNLGDEIPLTVTAGRLHETGYLRVQTVNYAIGDDGDETVEIGAGRPEVTLADLYTRTDSTLGALTRRAGGVIPTSP